VNGPAAEVNRTTEHYDARKKRPKADR